MGVDTLMCACISVRTYVSFYVLCSMCACRCHVYADNSSCAHAHAVHVRVYAACFNQDYEVHVHRNPMHAAACKVFFRVEKGQGHHCLEDPWFRLI